LGRVGEGVGDVADVGVRGVGLGRSGSEPAQRGQNRQRSGSEKVRLQAHERPPMAMDFRSTSILYLRPRGGEGKGGAPMQGVSFRRFTAYDGQDEPYRAPGGQTMYMPAR